MSWDKELAERRRTAPAEVQHLVEDLVARQRAEEYIFPPMEDQGEVDANEGVLWNSCLPLIEGVFVE
jgi:hypothetical protein